MASQQNESQGSTKTKMVLSNVFESKNIFSLSKFKSFNQILPFPFSSSNVEIRTDSNVIFRQNHIKDNCFYLPKNLANFCTIFLVNLKEISWIFWKDVMEPKEFLPTMSIKNTSRIRNMFIWMLPDGQLYLDLSDIWDRVENVKWKRLKKVCSRFYVNSICAMLESQK